ncbi:F-box protein SKIP23-like [Carex rostrata]
MPKKKTKSCTNGKRYWSELPEDILHIFSKKLHDISDFIRFRAVCKRWQLSAPVTDPPPQLPWLLENHFREYRENGIIRFYCLLSGKVHTINCPGSCHAWLEGPTCRYLLAYHLENSLGYLLNPLTCDQIHVLDAVNVCGFLPDYIGPYPIEGGDIVVMSGYNNMMAFWRREVDDWVYVKGVGDCYGGSTYYKGKYFSSEIRTGITNVIDIATKTLVYKVAPPVGTNVPFLKGFTFMVESGGKILRLFQYYEGEQCHFCIYALYFGDGKAKPCWVKITDIGDQMLFLGYNRGFSFCVSNFVGLKGNCIYFLEKKQYLCRYDIGDGITEVLPCPFDSMNTWFVPSLILKESRPDLGAFQHIKL